MRKRYCETILQKWYSCNSGFGSYYLGGKDGAMISKGCRDMPMEKNCSNIIEENDICCPTCGSPMKDDDIKHPNFPWVTIEIFLVYLIQILNGRKNNENRDYMYRQQSSSSR